MKASDEMNDGRRVRDASTSPAIANEKWVMCDVSIVSARCKKLESKISFHYMQIIERIEIERSDRIGTQQLR